MRPLILPVWRLKCRGGESNSTETPLRRSTLLIGRFIILPISPTVNTSSAECSLSTLPAAKQQSGQFDYDQLSCRTSVVEHQCISKTNRYGIIGSLRCLVHETHLHRSTSLFPVLLSPDVHFCFQCRVFSPATDRVRGTDRSVILPVPWAGQNPEDEPLASPASFSSSFLIGTPRAGGTSTRRARFLLLVSSLLREDPTRRAASPEKKWFLPLC